MPNPQATAPCGIATVRAMHEARSAPLLLNRGFRTVVDQLARLVRPPGRAAAVRQLESDLSRLCRGILGLGLGPR